MASPHGGYSNWIPSAISPGEAKIQLAAELEIDGVPVGEFTGIDEDGNIHWHPFFGDRPSGGGVPLPRGGGTLGMDLACRDAAAKCLVPTTVQARCAILKCEMGYCNIIYAQPMSFGRLGMQAKNIPQYHVTYSRAGLGRR